MSESELGRALLACDPPPVREARRMSERVLQRDRLRVQLLAALSLFLWLLAVGSVLFMVWFYFLFLEPRLWAMSRNPERFPDTSVWVTIANWAAWTVAAIGTTMLLAAISTVWLVFASRGATLRQVQAQLAEISAQLPKQAPASKERAQHGRLADTWALWTMAGVFVVLLIVAMRTMWWLAHRH